MGWRYHLPHLGGRQGFPQRSDGGLMEGPEGTTKARGRWHVIGQPSGRHSTSSCVRRILMLLLLMMVHHNHVAESCGGCGEAGMGKGRWGLQVPR